MSTLPTLCITGKLERVVWETMQVFTWRDCDNDKKPHTAHIWDEQITVAIVPCEQP